MRTVLAGIIAFSLLGCTPPIHSDENAKNAAPDTPHILWVGTTRLQPVEGEVGNGFAEVKLLSTEEMHLTLRANLVPVGEGYYEAWVGEGVSAKSIGRLAAKGESGTHTLAYQERRTVLQAPPASQSIFVTWEEDDDDPRPGERILEGTFTIIGK